MEECTKTTLEVQRKEKSRWMTEETQIVKTGEKQKLQVTEEGVDS